MANKEVKRKELTDRLGDATVPNRRDFIRRKYSNAGEANVGEAYAFFNCDVSLNGLNQTLPYARRDAQTPEELELSLQEGSAGLKIDGRLKRLLDYPDDYRTVTEAQTGDIEFEAKPLSSLKYVLAAKLPGQSNERAAEELRDIMHLIITGNDTQDYLRGRVVYRKEHGAYALMY